MAYVKRLGAPVVQPARAPRARRRRRPRRGGEPARCQRAGRPTCPGRLRLPRPALQPALLLLELPHLGDARPLGPARDLRRGLQARRLPHHQERLQQPPAGLAGALRAGRVTADALARRLVQQRGLPRPRAGRRPAGREGATSARSPSTPSATSVPRSASTTRAARRWAGSRTCGTPRCCSSPVPTSAWWRTAVAAVGAAALHRACAPPPAIARGLAGASRLRPDRGLPACDPGPGGEPTAAALLWPRRQPRVGQGRRADLLVRVCAALAVAVALGGPALARDGRLGRGGPAADGRRDRARQPAQDPPRPRRRRLRGRGRGRRPGPIGGCQGTCVGETGSIVRIEHGR